MYEAEIDQIVIETILKEVVDHFTDEEIRDLFIKYPYVNRGRIRHTLKYYKYKTRTLLDLLEEKS